MAECSEIGLMLGAFEDAELEPNEMQEVAYHLARCETCTSILTDYSSLGRELRSITTAPDLAGFSRAVIARIDRLPQSVFRRIERFLRRSTESIGSGFAWGGAVAAVAVLTVILLSPYAQKFSNRQVPSTVPASSQLADATVARPAIVGEPALDDSAMADGDSHAVISRLESDNPSMAVWSEPRKDTTVIWLPDQP
jgi:anti-sigma factor RsiW